MWFLSAALAAPAQPVTLPATGRHEAIFEIPRFGRYAITAESSQGTQVRVIDRMAGLLAERGQPGERDGRADVFLDRGDVKVVTVSDPAGTGQVTVRATPFSEPPAPAALQPQRKVASTLQDLETRAYWIDFGGDAPLVLEAAGRYLGDLRLWREGSWLVDAAPTCTRYEPSPGQPWTRCSLSAPLESGLYLVVAYGGPGEPWAEEREVEPFELQWGWPALPSAGQRSDTLGPSGFVRYRLPMDATTAQLSLPEVAAVRLSMGPASSPFAEGRTSSITAESRRPVASASDSSRTEHIVTVTGPPGQPYTLTWYPPTSSTTTLAKPGRYWVSTVSPSDPADVHPPTAVLYRRLPDGRAIRAAAQAVPVSSAARIEERFNLAESTSLLLEVSEGGPYVVWVEGLHANLTVSPYLVDPGGPELTKPKPQADELRVELDPGLYLLELAPREPGIATLHIGHDSWAARARRQIGQAPPALALRPAIQLPAVEIEAQAPLTLQLFGAPRDPMGLIVRSLPVDPFDGLPVTLMSGETLDIPVDPRTSGALSFVTAQGVPLPLQLDGALPSGQLEVNDALHTVRVMNTTKAPILGTLAMKTPDTSTSPLPPLDSSVLAELPQFPKLGQGRGLGVDLEEDERETVELGVDKSGLWILESTGLLATEASVRTRTQTSLLEARANGAGRNFEIAGYLRSGDYQLTVSAVAPSKGHAGLRLRQGLVRDGGEIRDATPARVTVPAGSAVRHTLVVALPGEYRVVHHGQTRLFSCRLEDAQGWPITDAPQQSCSFTAWLEAGSYALVGLPERVDSRRITTVEPAVTAPIARSGHGPFELGLGAPASHVWVEPSDPSAERPLDVWTAKLPAPVTATVTLSAEMTGEIKVGQQSLARLVPGEGWTGELPEGPVQIEVRGARRGTGLPYTLRLEPHQLVAGMSRGVSVPETLEVAVGQPMVYTLGSEGPQDVRARLLDSEGRVVAANDDRPDDWNFRLSALLQPGRYQLVIHEVSERGAPLAQPVSEPDTGIYVEETEEIYEEPVETYYDRGLVSVTMRSPQEVDGGSLASGQSRTLRPGADAIVVALDEKKAEIVVARATSGENVGVAIEAQDGASWRALAHGTGREAVAVARLDRQAVRVRTWSEDVRGGPVELKLIELRSRKVAEGAIASGVDLGKDHGALEIAGGEGQFALEGDARGVWVCPEVGAGCELASDRWARAGAKGLVLVRAGGNVQARRVDLQDGVPAVLPLYTSPQRLDVGPGGLAVLEVRGSGEQPMARFGDGPVLVAQHGGGLGAAVALRPRGAQSATLWGDGDGKVLLRTLNTSKNLSVQDGAHVIELPPRSTLSVGTGGTRDVVASLEAGLFAVAADGRGQWAEPGPVAAHLRAISGPLLLVNPTDRAGIAHLDVRPSGGPAELTHGSPHERVHGARETWSVPVPQDQPDSVIEVRGTARATLVRHDGQVLRGETLPVGPGGTLSLEVEPGAVLAWVARPGESGPVRQVQESVVLELKAGATAAVRGDAVRLELKPPGPGAVSLVAPCPAVATVEIPGGWSRTAVLSPGERLDLWLPQPKQPAIVHLRALAGTVLYGELVSSHAPATPTAEGLGPEVLLSPGGSAWFSFQVQRQGQVGLGARAAAERVDAVLHDATGQELARGLVILQDLAPGDYLLSLSQPAGTAPVRARPAVVGLSPPPTTPPLDVIEQYRALAEETP